jgi:hypothetical protein
MMVPSPWGHRATPTIQFSSVFIRAQIADAALQFWSGIFPALMKMHFATLWRRDDPQWKMIPNSKKLLSLF